MAEDEDKKKERKKGKGKGDGKKEEEKKSPILQPMSLPLSCFSCQFIVRATHFHSEIRAVFKGGAGGGGNRPPPPEATTEKYLYYDVHKDY